jgi:hypothetical protein
MDDLQHSNIHNSSNDRKYTKEEICNEISLVEEIIAASRKDSSLDHASKLSMQLLRTHTTASFSAIDITEYIGYIRDVQRHLEKGNVQAANDAKFNVQHSLQEIEQDLRAAKNKLQSWKE